MPSSAATDRTRRSAALDPPVARRAGFERGPGRPGGAAAIAGAVRALALALALVLGFDVASGAGTGQARSSAAGPDVAEPVSREYAIKAAFLYNFAKFTEWPVGSFDVASAPLEVCVLGDDPFGPALDTIAGKTIGGHGVVVRRVEGVAGTDRCHVLFVSGSEQARLAEILATLRRRPILTVADMPDFARAGGIIALKTDAEQRVRFEINTRTAGDAGLRLSSKLLSLADIAPN